MVKTIYSYMYWLFLPNFGDANGMNFLGNNGLGGFILNLNYKYSVFFNEIKVN